MLPTSCISARGSCSGSLRIRGAGGPSAKFWRISAWQEVCRQLVETRWSIEKIAVQGGFSSGSYLHTVFRKRYGYTPSEYRRKNAKV
ncbi:AraC family transcriptional regulator [Paenibacillus sp. AR247]|uniref:helix-turn-helix domain-containing protein n=1 Tax=Paenibacillus sp. AR247 TaxID=1631599 RepID=UPI00280BA25F|nr:helix-turn-helix domain-containing protein [Paenibacillus sp. AR247]